jgi:ribosome maturation protein SDO1
VILLAVSIEKAVVARLHYSGQKFEVMVDPEGALELKRGKKMDLREVLAVPCIFRDVRSSMRVAEQDLQKIFGTVDVWKIAEKIIKNGELQFTTEQRRKMIENKITQIATIISKRGINPQTGSPHPVQRIISAMKEVGVNVDPFTDAELQIDKVVNAIKKLLPISFQKIVVEVKIPSQFAGSANSTLKKFGGVLSEQWLGDGSLQARIEMMAGMQDEFFQKISSITHGQFESKVIKSG